jgi:hypothetical protein
VTLTLVAPRCPLHSVNPETMLGVRVRAFLRIISRTQRYEVLAINP